MRYEVKDIIFNVKLSINTKIKKILKQNHKNNLNKFLFKLFNKLGVNQVIKEKNSFH